MDCYFVILQDTGGIALEIQHFAALSLNPALDITLRVSGISHEYNDVLHEQWEAAGKAVNVARVLKQFGVECQTLVLAGRQNHHRYFHRLDQDGIPYTVIETEGEIRENLSIVLPDDTLFRLARPGFTVDDAVIDLVLARLVEMVTPGTLFVLAGKNPIGLSFAAYRSICQMVQAMGGTLAVDTSSLCEQELFEVRPWIIKPNISEFEQMSGMQFASVEDLLPVVDRYHRNGIENILISWGEKGIFFSGEGGQWIAQVPPVHVRSAVGAGDSTLGGYLLAYASGAPIAQCIQAAASFGTASVMRDGTNPPLMEDLREIYPCVKVQAI